MNKSDIEQICIYLEQLKSTYKKTQKTLKSIQNGPSFESFIMKFNIDKLDDLIEKLKSLSSL